MGVESALPPRVVLRGRALRTDRAAVMAILNRTPDSFYDQGRTFDDDAALAAVDRMVADGADLVDVGGCKAGQQGDEVTSAEELRRVVPFITAVRERHPDLVLSVDTWRHEVAEAACAAGADLVNDTWAGWDPELVHVAAQYGAGYVVSHTGGLPPRTDPVRPRYDDVVTQVRDHLVAGAERAAAAGVPRDGILVDPTIDFGKTTAHGLLLLRHLDVLVATGWPVLVALSMKDLVGETLDVPRDERLPGTLAATALAASQGAAVFRAHHVVETRQVCEMTASIQGRRPPAAPVRGLG